MKLQFLIPKFVEGSSFRICDLDCSRSVIEEEYKRWKLKWNSVPANEKPANAIDALNCCSVKSYPNITTLLRIFATLPVTTASAERTFSCLRLLKTYLRSVMAEARLNGLTSMYIHRDICVDPEGIVDILASKRRKLDFVI